MPDATSVLLDGPWTHRDYSTNGVRLHVAEAGAGPLVLLLHGFPEFWWSWRHQISALTAAGFRVAAPDLRGYGASDKPPRGYDLVTLSADVAGLVRALGERRATIVGHEWGGLLAWSVAALHPQVLRSLVVLSMPHPRRLRSGLLRNRRQLASVRSVLAFQVPRYEMALTANGGAYIETLMRRWSGPVWRGTPDFVEAAGRCRSAIQIPQAAYGALEGYRWAARSALRTDGLRYARAMIAPVMAPTLQIHGGLDPCLVTATARGSDRYVEAAYELRVLEAIGHFPHEEAPAAISGALVDWAQRS